MAASSLTHLSHRAHLEHSVNISNNYYHHQLIVIIIVIIIIIIAVFLDPVT